MGKHDSRLLWPRAAWTTASFCLAVGVIALVLDVAASTVNVANVVTSCATIATGVAAMVWYRSMGRGHR